MILLAPTRQLSYRKNMVCKTRFKGQLESIRYSISAYYMHALVCSRQCKAYPKMSNVIIA